MDEATQKIITFLYLLIYLFIFFHNFTSPISKVHLHSQIPGVELTPTA